MNSIPAPRTLPSSIAHTGFIQHHFQCSSAVIELCQLVIAQFRRRSIITLQYTTLHRCKNKTAKLDSEKRALWTAVTASMGRRTSAGQQRAAVREGADQYLSGTWYYNSSYHAPDARTYVSRTKTDLRNTPFTRVCPTVISVLIQHFSQAWRKSPAKLAKLAIS